jgi:hypothetical protein
MAQLYADEPPVTGLATDRPVLGGAVLLSALITGWVVAQPFPPLQDFPDWIYQAYLFSRLMAGDQLAEATFALAAYPVPNSLSQVAMGLMMVMGVAPMVAAKLWLALYGIGFVSVAWLALRQLKPAECAPALAVLSVAVIFSSSYWNGYINFQYALLFLSAFLLIREVHHRRDLWILTLFGILIFFSHAVVFAAFVLYVGIRDVIYRRNYRAAAGLIPSLALLAWYILAKDPANAEPAPTVGAYQTVLQFFMYKAYTLMKLGPFHNFVGIDGRGRNDLLPPLYWAGIGLNVVFAALLSVTILMAFVDKFTRRSGAWARLDPYDARPVLLLPTALLLGCFAAAPDVIVDVINIGERFLMAALVFVLLAIPLRRKLLTAVALVGLLAIPLNVWFMATAPTEAPPQAQVQSHRQHGLFSHRLYQFKGQAEFLLSGDRNTLPEQKFRTSIIVPAEP